MLQSRPRIAEIGFISLVGLAELKRSSPEFPLLWGEFAISQPVSVSFKHVLSLSFKIRCPLADLILEEVVSVY